MATLKKAKTVAKSSTKSVKGKATPAPKVKLKATVKKAVKTTAKAGTKATTKAAANATLKKAKAVAKSPPKVISKKAAKAPIKVTAKESTKLISKVSTKAASKAVAKPVAKPTPKSAPKPTPKPVATKAAKTVEPVAHKAMPKPAAKSTRSGTLLTETELVKQPKSEYMSKDQLAFFKNRLMQLQDQLRQNAGATTEHLRELAVAPDPADRATLEEEHALELRARDRERKLLKKVDAVLLLIDSGEYGYCEETGEPIGIPRLLARPTATLTIEAQERRELKQKMYGE